MKKNIYLFCNWFEFILSGAGFLVAWFLANFAFAENEVNVQYNQELNEQKTVLRKQMEEFERKNTEAVEQETQETAAPEVTSNQTAQDSKAVSETAPAIFHIEKKNEEGELVKVQLTREEAEEILDTPERWTWKLVPVSTTQKSIAVVIGVLTILTNIIGLYLANRGRYIINTLLLPFKFILAPLYFGLGCCGLFFSLFSALNIFALPGTKKVKDKNEQIRNAAFFAGLAALCYFLAKCSVKPANEIE